MHPRAFAEPLDAATRAETSERAQTRVVLVGPPECGKTTLLLRFCVRYVREKPDGRVLYIASERAMDRARVHATRDELLKDDPRALDRIGIKYAEDDQDVRALCCFRHAAPANAQPTAYVVDDLGSLIKCGGKDRVKREIAYAKTLAALHESARDDESGEERLVVVSERRDEELGGVPMGYVYARWFGEVMQACEVGNGEWDLVRQSDMASVRYSTRSSARTE